MEPQTRRKPHVPINQQVFLLCGAKGKRNGQPCKAPAMANGRCRFHGGKSTGPKTEAGKKAISKAHYQHGLYTNTMKRLKQLERAFNAGSKKYWTLLTETPRADLTPEDLAFIQQWGNHSQAYLRELLTG